MDSQDVVITAADAVSSRVSDPLCFQYDATQPVVGRTLNHRDVFRRSSVSHNKSFRGFWVSHDDGRTSKDLLRLADLGAGCVAIETTQFRAFVHPALYGTRRPRHRGARLVGLRGSAYGRELQVVGGGPAEIGTERESV